MSGWKASCKPGAAVSAPKRSKWTANAVLAHTPTGDRLTRQVESAAESVWQRQAQWSRLASILFVRFTRRRVTNLALLVAAAILGAFASYPSTSHGWAIVFAGVAAVALTVAGYIQYALLSDDKMDRNSTVRSVAESLKAEIYRYLTGVQPYDRLGDGQLLARAQAIEEPALPFLVEAQQLSRVDRPLPPVRDLSSYLEVRVVSQRDWFLRRAEFLNKRGARARGFQIAATVTAAIVVGLSPVLGNKIATAAAGAAAILAALSAYVGTIQYKRIAKKYTEIRVRLDLLLERVRIDDSDAARKSFVEDVERVLHGIN